MRELKKHPFAKIVAVILTICFIAVFALSIIGIVLCYEYGCYEGKKKETVIDDEFELILDRYSIQALSDYKGKFNRDKLDKTNFRYGVIECDKDELDDIDLNDPSSYVTRNFDKKVTEDELHIFSYVVGENTIFDISDNFFDRGNYIYNNSYDYSSDERTGVVEIIYIEEADKIVVRTDGDDYFIVKDGSVIDDDRGLYYIIKGMDDQEYYIPQSCVVIFGTAIDFEEYSEGSMSEFPVISPVFASYHFEESGYFEAYLDDKTSDELNKDENLNESGTKETFKTYTVVSFVNEPLIRKESFVENDMFIWGVDTVGFLFQLRYWLFILLPVSIALVSYLIYFLITAAGHRRGTDEISRSVVDIIPQDIFLIGLLFYAAVYANISYRLLNILDLESLRIIAYIIGLATAMGAILFMLFVMNFATNVKLGHWWRHLFIYRFFALIGRGIKKAYWGITRGTRNVLNSLIIWGILLAVSIVEFICLMSFATDDFIGVLWLIEKAAIVVILIIAMYQIAKIRSGCEALGKGNIGSKIDTKGLMPDLAEIAKDINSVSDGLSVALAEQTKSERFRTELITNVSHDIKTPLTSIINYTDLLSREKIDNPNAGEYIEVLSRQSARLKKLIEDLIEASKASTGNVKMDMEKLNIATLLEQAVAEYQPKLQKKGITIITKVTDEDVSVLADSRHLWRVFDNFLNNIFKYAMNDSRAYIDVSRNEMDGKVLVTFKNISKEGLNISASELMERFVRGDSSRNTEGSGLGLSIARSLTELMNGEVNVFVDGDLFKVTVAFPHYES